MRNTRDYVRFSVDISPEMDALLDQLVRDLGASDKSEVMRKAIALIKVASEAKRDGRKLYFADQLPPGDSQEIVGI